MVSLTDSNDGDATRRWYDLFSRGTRDWLRHNEKVREAVREHLPEMIAGSDVLSDPRNRSVRVPVKLMEHHRFRLRDTQEQKGAGQGGDVEPGDVLRQGQPQPGGGEQEGGGEGEGPISFVLELQVDEILDWLWEELSLPNLQPRSGDAIETDELVREGWDKRGARSRLDRRRTMKEAIKRRSAQPESSVPISNEDLRFRQLARRTRPTTNAAVIFLLDVSSSMDDRCRRLAKSFFFWALQGVRRQFSHIETAFIAHTVDAWEFEEEQFFQVHGEGGTKSSTGFRKARQILEERFNPSQYNCYLFYATDGHNFSEDRERATGELLSLAPALNFAGYAEVSSFTPRRFGTEVATIWQRLAAEGHPSGSYALNDDADIWPAIKRFFTDQAAEVEES